jgi:2-polyprenyl-3-methyl-5-hydroxy-6-metoxy-1,4-benzoquinol methylase
MKERLLEPVLRRMRIARVVPYLQRYPMCTLLDVGCGSQARLLREIEPYIGRGVGIDFKAPVFETAKLTAISVTLDDALPFDDRSYDVVTMLAVLEHLQKPQMILREIARVLRPGGGLILTVPSWSAKPVLEFLAYRLGIVNPDEIRDHKRYFDRADLFAAMAEAPPLSMREHRYFQCGFNNFLFAVKEGA